MGYNFYPVYGDPDLGSAIEGADKSLAKIKTNQFDTEDLKKAKVELEKVISAIDTAIAKDEQEN